MLTGHNTYLGVLAVMNKAVKHLVTDRKHFHQVEVLLSLLVLPIPNCKTIAYSAY